MSCKYNNCKHCGYKSECEIYKENAELEDKLTKKVTLESLDVVSARIKGLEKENAELRKVAEFQQSSNMSRHFENKKLKEGLAVGSTFNKALNSMNKNLEEERDKYRNMVFDKDEQLTKAKEIIKRLLCVVRNHLRIADVSFNALINDAEKILKEE